ncbi:CipC1 protein [Scleroderma citrinum]
MAFFSADSPEANAHNEVHSKGNYAHEFIAGAIAYEAMRKYNEYRANGGQVNNHAHAQDLIAGFATDALTDIVKTMGRDTHDAFHLAEANRRLKEVVSRDNYNKL